ncbi:hypothetical protein EJB05_22346, partial [Eragrostis curvula]
MADDTIFNIAPVSNCTPLRQNELHAHLFLHHTVLGANHNQASIAEPGHRNGFGSTIVNDWAVTDSLGPEARVVARARGIHIQAGLDTKSYYVSFNMIFDDGRVHTSGDGPCCRTRRVGHIVGGTGEFTLAKGVIYKKFHEQRGDGNIMELDIHAFYTPMERSQ